MNDEIIERKARQLYREYVDRVFGGYSPGTYHEWRWKWREEALVALEESDDAVA